MSDERGTRLVRRPPELAQDDTPMIDVVKHVLEQIPGEPDQKIVLLQPTQPLREPKHITAALELLTPEVDSVVSVVELPRAYAPELLCAILDEQRWNKKRRGWLAPLVGSWGYGRFCGGFECESYIDGWADVPTRRQDVEPVYQRDGTVYAFWRKTVTEHRTIYGEYVKPLVIPKAESQALDTPEDWIEAERRLRERG